MGFKVTVYCHDRNEVTFEQTFDKWRDAHACAMEQIKTMHVNTSVGIQDHYEIDNWETDTPVAPV